MNEPVIAVQARLGSSRLPRKVLLPFYGSETILSILLKRLRSTGLRVILATTSAPEDQAVASLGQSLGVDVHRGPEDDVVMRFLQATAASGCTHLIRVCSDNPFLDADLLMQLAAVAADIPDVDYAAHFCDGKPSIATQYGVFAELVSRSALQKVVDCTNASVYREHVTNYIHQRPDQFKIHYLPVDSSNFLPQWVRLTIDTPNDFEVAAEVYSALMDRCPESYSLQDLRSVIDSKPHLRTKMEGQLAMVDKQFLLEKETESR